GQAGQPGPGARPDEGESSSAPEPTPPRAVRTRGRVAQRKTQCLPMVSTEPPEGASSVTLDDAPDEIKTPLVKGQTHRGRDGHDGPGAAATPLACARATSPIDAFWWRSATVVARELPAPGPPPSRRSDGRYPFGGVRPAPLHLSRASPSSPRPRCAP